MVEVTASEAGGASLSLEVAEAGGTPSFACLVMLTDPDELFALDRGGRGVLRASLSFDPTGVLRVGPWRSCFDGVLCPEVANSDALRQGLLDLGVERRERIEVRISSRVTPIVTWIDEIDGRWQRRETVARGPALRWQFEEKPGQSVRPAGFWVLGPDGSFEIICLKSGTVVGAGESRNGRTWFEGDRRLVPGRRYAIRGPGAATSHSRLVVFREGTPRSTAEILMSGGRLRVLRTAAGRALLYYGAIEFREAIAVDREMQILFSIAWRNPGSPAPIVGEEGSRILDPDVTILRASRVLRSRLSAGAIHVLELPPEAAGFERDCYVQVRALGVGGTGEAACSDVVGIRIEDD